MANIGRSGRNSLRICGAIPDDELLEAVDASYQAVVAKLPGRTARPGPDLAWLPPDGPAAGHFRRARPGGPPVRAHPAVLPGARTKSLASDHQRPVWSVSPGG